MRILVVDDEPKELEKIVTKLREGLIRHGIEENDFEIVETDSVQAVRQLIDDHREDEDWVLDHVYSDGLAEPGGWSFGCATVHDLLRERGPNRTSPGMTVVSYDVPNEIVKEIGAGFIFKPMIDVKPALLID